MMYNLKLTDSQHDTTTFCTSSSLGNHKRSKAIVTFFMGRPDYSVCFLPYTEIDLAKPPYTMYTTSCDIHVHMYMYHCPCFSTC